MHGEAPPPFDAEEAVPATKTTQKIINIGKLGTTLDNLWQYWTSLVSLSYMYVLFVWVVFLSFLRTSNIHLASVICT